ncbi:hypothetical protein KEM56_007619 [Ascosphaera pollenicola]|nr:hypothetical protein KEM56_007619 [Ascosphaera pollenicola]
MTPSFQLHEDSSSDTAEPTDIGPAPSSPTVSHGAASSSFSDKENWQQDDAPTRHTTKQRRVRMMEEEEEVTPETPDQSTAAAAKRRRLDDAAIQARQSQSTHQRVLDETKNGQIYDPDQSPEERRKVRQQYRNLVAEMNDSRAEYLKASSHQLDDAVEQANELFHNVKQTSDATVDSRFLVSAADLSLKRITQAVLGDATASIDVDEFVSKCISYMRNSPINNDLPMSTQNRRPTHTQMDEDAEDDEDPLNWDWLGRRACFASNTRPPVTGFLLGPMSVRKRTRLFTQRRATQRIDPTQAVRPQELKQADLVKQETSNLTTMCTEILEVLKRVRDENLAKARVAMEELPEGASFEEQVAMGYKYGISNDEGVPLFKFCINPDSFGQTVENLFYVSFLVRDGMVGINIDDMELPTLFPTDPETLAEAKKNGIEKHEAIFEIDFKSWKELIDVFNIKESIIPHREEEEGDAMAATWYS